MPSLDLSSEHLAALSWFQSKAGKTVSWAELQNGPSILTISAKGIYKPQSLPYALSVRQGLDSPYIDEEPQFQSDGSWRYRYAQEEQAKKNADELFTNQGLHACMRDGIPVAVLRQVSKKPDTRYHVLGLARVVDWAQGVFTLNSTMLDVPFLKLDKASATSEDALNPFHPYDPNHVDDARVKVMREITARQGQAAFRSGLLTAYRGRCAISGCDVSDVLEAAHVTPYLGPETNCVTNGMLLRCDFHTLWDKGLLYLERDMCVQVHARLGGTEYATWNQKTVFIPESVSQQLSPEALQAHRDWCLQKR
ncbi:MULTISPECIES: HNH endonuclease [unclassified Undibacterium]|uniref:HNH endonuclease n=1 Tax=unclassified Undibacterium TaxID=2630295 RepID=UPI002AC9E24C|nr:MULTISPECIES: HNH endonuclease [unclassified Undibacterium]MEB0140728.1 HNH endonuclease [Undibacterium sp. CCC2.1]MEB0173737.1 HNH endonuclease [Undibacterium sp. CCC1.1]MEB0178103.1 HNH endonuclease [Undibacterium sp. CCC3.4]MEB0216913.1 HNH endonuclease [Undibacterium sp. 5I2]WPX41979.1 HNH endonuclease [Undibacterium sp. CCC3.4]